MKEIIVKHPLINHKMSILRDVKTGTKEFRELMNELAMLMTYEAMRDAKTTEVKVVTPMEETKGEVINENEYAFVPILRAGIGLVDGVLRILPNAKIGHIGMYRNEETLEPVSYYFKVPSNIENRTVFLLDPMLATGGSAASSITELKKNGAKKIIFLCIVATREGIKRVQTDHPDVQIYSAALDRGLNEIGYIVPGLGDAGDRIFGTK